MRKQRALLLMIAFAVFAVASRDARAQGIDAPSCSLGRITERFVPDYPQQLNGRIVQGVVQLTATFAPDGHVTNSKVITGPSELRFTSESYVRGWRAEKSDAPRVCAITISFRFDGSQAVCGPRNSTHLTPEREDETHVTMRLRCDIW